MIVFLNYLPTLLIVLGMFVSGYLFIKNKRGAAVFGTVAAVAAVAAVVVLLLVLLKAVTPSYMPKGEVPKMPITMPETKELPPVVDRTLKPELTNEERAEQFGQKFDAVKQSQ